MKSINLFLLVSCTVLLLMSSVDRQHVSTDANSNTINAILGDVSYITAFGKAPNSSVTDSERIDTHLKYVEDLLRSSHPDEITTDQIQQRHYFLNQLREYRMAGNFPVNDDHPDRRRPTFISNNGNICAVGFLVEQSAGREVAERINEQFKYSYILEIDDPVFLNWVNDSGFTLKELAMIQPSYMEYIEVERNNNRLGASYAVASGTLLTANTLFWTHEMNKVQLFDNNEVNRWAGLAVGAGTILLGSLNMNNTSQRQVVKDNMMWSHTTTYIETNHLRTGVSTGHIVVGAATFLRAAYQLMNPSQQPANNESGLVATNFTLPHAKGYASVSGIGYRFAIN